MQWKYGSLVTVAAVVLFLACFMVAPPLALADGKEFIAEATYPVGRGANKADAEQKACAGAQEIAVDKATVFLSAQPDIVVSRLAQDDIRAIVEEIMTTTFLEKKPIIDKNSVKMYARIKGVLDMDQVKIKIKNRQLLAKSKIQPLAVPVNEKSVGPVKLQPKKAPAAAATAKSGAEDWAGKGYDAITGKDYDRSIICYKKAIELNPQYADAYNGLGSAFYRKGQYDDSIREFEKAIALNPKDFYACYNVALAYEKKERYQDAVKAYRKFIEYAPASDYEEQIKFATERIHKIES